MGRQLSLNVPSTDDLSKQYAVQVRIRKSSLKFYKIKTEPIKMSSV